MFERLPLKDIHLPDPVSWWPPAPGWWLLPILLVLLWPALRALAAKLRGSAGRRRLRRQALRELERIERRFAETGDPRSTVESISVLLRRVAISVSHDRRVAGLAGKDWLEWIRSTGPGNLEPAAVSALAHAPYRRSPDVPPRDVLDTARSWIRHVTTAGSPPS